MSAALDRLHAAVRRSPWLRRFTAFTRILLAVGFIPPGMTKVLGNRFTQLPVEHPVGFFFEAFYRAHAFYWLAGVAQVLAGLLLLVPRTAHLGAMLFLTVITNIVAITWSIDFAGTKFITLLMLLAALYLVAWDYDRWKALLPRRQAGGQGAARGLLLWSALFAAGGVGMAALVVTLRLSNLGWADFPRIVVTLGVGGGVFGLAGGLHCRAMPVAQAGEGRETEPAA